MILLWHRTSHQADICLKDHHQASLQTLLISPLGLTFGRRCWTCWIVPSVVGAGNSWGDSSRVTFWWYLESPRYRQVWWCMVGTNRSLCLNKTAHQSESSGWLTLDWCAKFVVTFVVVTWLWFYVGFYEGFLCGRSEFGEFLMSCLHFFASFPRWWIGCPDQYL